MQKIIPQENLINKCGLIALGILCAGYAIRPEQFAEMYISFSFLDFPVFVGEIFLALCLTLFLVKHRGRLTFRKDWKWQWLFMAYLVFVLAKALWGYSNYGPLALRHAALFYYPIFGILAYSFYYKEYFTLPRKIILCFLLMGIIRGPHFYAAWLLTFSLLNFILIGSFRDKTLSFFFAAVLIAIIPFQRFVVISRMMIVSNAVSFVFLIVVFWWVWKTKKRVKMAVAIFLIASAFGLCVLKGDRQVLRSIVDVSAIKARFQQYETLRLKALKDYREPELKEVKLFNPSYQTYANHIARRVFLSKKVIRLMKQKGKNVASEEERAIEAGELRIREGEEIKPARTEEGSAFAAQETQLVPTEEWRAFTAEEINRLTETGELLPNIKPPLPPTEAATNIVFRLFIWRDMSNEFLARKPFLLGFDFGKPFRSISLEVLRWGEGEWSRDGWVAMHNSYLDMIYYAGLVGLLFSLSVIFMWLKMVKDFIAARSVSGILLCAIILNWLIAANFLVTLEVPYTAIPIWVLYGLTVAYYQDRLKSTAEGI